MTPRGIVFDLDETLYPERRFALSGYAAVARHVEKTTAFSAARCFRALVHALRRGRRATAFQEACRACAADPAAIDEWLAVYRAHAPRLRLPRASRTVLHALRPSWRLAVLTNGLPAIQRAKVDALGIEALVDVVVYAGEHGTGRGKPERVVFKEVLERLAVTPDRAVMVGDDVACDVAGARAAGLRAVWLRGGVVRRRGPMQPATAGDGRADAVIDWLGELPAALDRLGVGEEQYAH